MAFKPLSWTNTEVITLDKIKQMSENDQFLKDSQIIGIWRGDGITLNKGIKILAGRALIQPSGGMSAIARVSFNNFFSQGCEPVVALGVVTDYERRVHASAEGWSGTRPDHRGMNVTAHVMQMAAPDEPSIKKAFFIDYIVLGY